MNNNAQMPPMQGQVHNPFIGTTPMPADVQPPQQQNIQVPPTAPQPSQVVPGTTTNQEPVGTNPQNEGFQNTAQATGSESPLDKYKEIVDNDKGKEGNQQQQEQKPPEQSLDLNSLEVDQFQKVAGSINFTNGVTQEQVDAALKGDAEAFMKVLNQVAQNGYAQAVHSGGRLAGTAMNQQFDSFKGTMPELIRENQITSMAKEADLSHPALKPMYDSAVNMFANKYPDSSAEHIHKMAREYMKDAATALIGNNVGEQKKKEQQTNSLDVFDF